MIPVKALSPMLVMIDGKLWARCKARKAGVCLRTRATYKPGTEVFRPMTNGKNRMKRILASVLDKVSCV